MAKAAKKAPAKKKASKPTAPAKPGRPSTFTQELAAELCRRIADGASLRKVCEAEDMPDRKTVRNWLALGEAEPEKYPEYAAFLPQYARACDDRADAIAEDVFDIADDGRNDWMEAQTDKGGSGWAFNGEHVQRSKLRVDARKWYLEKVAPKRYGTKVVQEVTGAGGGPIEVTEVPARDYGAIRRKIAEKAAASTHH